MINRRPRQAARKSLRFESLETRQMLSVTPTISISDATAIEGSDQLKLLDQFIASDSGGLTRPRVPVFGPDSTGDGVKELYVASADTDEILRFDGGSGAFLDVFVPAGSGGLDAPLDLEFTPDGNLYVSTHVNQSPETSKVLRYDGITGAFLEEIASGLNGAHGISWHDGALYVTTHYGSEVFKYDSSGFNVFVPAGSGGLNGARHALFGVDANGDAVEDLYVASQNTKQVLRYDGLTGAFIDVFVTMDALATWIEFGPDGDLYVVGAQSGGGRQDITRFDTATREVLDVFSTGQAGWPVTADAQNILYNSNIVDRSVYRYGASSLAAFKVSLSAPSATPVSVDYQTINGAAIAGDDYVAASGTLTFAPGQTSRTILVPTVDNGAVESSETFTVNLANAVGATLADDQGVGTVYDDETPPTKFYVVDDASQNRTFEYNITGRLVENYNVNSGNSTPRGVASSLAGDKTWVVDANRKVYVYNTSGGLLASWTAGTLAHNATPEGIATNGTDVWIVDGRSDKVYRYAGAAGLSAGNPVAAGSFNLASGNTNPKDIVTDGQSLWVVDDGPKTDKVYKYTLSGVSLGGWTIDSANKAPTGITIDPANVGAVWIVDSGTDRVYQYTAAAFRTSLSQGASATFALAPGNTNPQGIADPPAPSSVPSTEQTNQPALTSDLAFTAMASEGGQSQRFTRRSKSPFQTHDTDRVTPHWHWPASTTVDLGRTAARNWAPARRASFDSIEGVVASVDSAFAELAVSATLQI